MAELPSYLELHRTGELHRRAAEARERLAACNLCPRACGVNRLQGEEGYCRAGAMVRVASWNAHMWEEPPISGTRGSGTIFFAFCTGRCLFCQNYPISQLGAGKEVLPERVGGMMMELQRRGCHNINLVTPSHYVPQILTAVDAAAERGLHIPILYNTSGYDAVETLRLLDGVVDIYLPDAKYADDAVARRLSGFVDYTRHNRAALLEMKRQVGARLQVDDAAAERGLNIPILYNTSGYDAVETLRLLDGVVDIYLPDAKYADDAVARRLSGFVDYTRHNRAALLEMKRQVGARLQVDGAGIAIRGMVVRHLVLPNRLSQTADVLHWLAQNLGREVYVSLMAQYFPAYHAVGHPELGRRLTPREYGEALAALKAEGLENGWRQETDGE